MDGIFRIGKENAAARCLPIAREFRRRGLVFRACPTKRPVDVSPAERPKGKSGKDIQAFRCNMLREREKRKPPELGSLPAGCVAHGLAVVTPLRRRRLASEQIPCVRTIQHPVEML